MPRVNDYLDLVDTPSRQGLTPGDPADDALIALLAHVAFTDGEVDEQELDFLEKVLPGRDREELLAWAETAGSVPLDLAEVWTIRRYKNEKHRIKPDTRVRYKWRRRANLKVATNIRVWYGIVDHLCPVVSGQSYRIQAMSDMRMYDLFVQQCRTKGVPPCSRPYLFGTVIL